MERILTDNDSFVALLQNELNSGTYDYIHGTNTFQHFFNDKICNSASDDSDDDDSGSDSSSESEVLSDSVSRSGDSSSEEDDDSDEEEEEEEKAERLRLEKMKRHCSMKAPNPHAVQREFPPSPCSTSIDEMESSQEIHPIILVRKGPSPLPSGDQVNSLKMEIRHYQTNYRLFREKFNELQQRKSNQLERMKQHYVNCFQYERDVLNNLNNDMNIEHSTCEAERLIVKPGLTQPIFDRLISSLNGEYLNTLLFCSNVEREWGETQNFYCITLDKSELIVTVRK